MFKILAATILSLVLGFILGMIIVSETQLTLSKEIQLTGLIHIFSILFSATIIAFFLQKSSRKDEKRSKMIYDYSKSIQNEIFNIVTLSESMTQNDNGKPSIDDQNKFRITHTYKKISSMLSCFQDLIGKENKIDMDLYHTFKASFFEFPYEDKSKEKIIADIQDSANKLDQAIIKLVISS